MSLLAKLIFSYKYCKVQALKIYLITLPIFPQFQSLRNLNYCPTVCFFLSISFNIPIPILIPIPTYNHLYRANISKNLQIRNNLHHGNLCIRRGYSQIYRLLLRYLRKPLQVLMFRYILNCESIRLFFLNIKHHSSFLYICLIGFYLPLLLN